MKFEKRLRAEIVPEWRARYIDYKGLKKRLRHIRQSRERALARESDYNSRPRSPNVETFSPPQRTLSMTSMASSFFHKVSSALVTIQKQQNFHAPPPQIISLDTLMDQVNPEERLFFVALDKELIKIETFCESKENEASLRMNLLTQQYERLNEERNKKPSRRNTRTFVKQGFEYLKSSSVDKSDKYRSGGLHEQSMDLETAKKMIKKAVFEFYRSVELLKNYCVLNYIGFAKLLKKYDRVSERNGYKVYMQKVTKTYSDKSSILKNLLKEAEDFYANLEGGSRSRAIRKLRLPNKEHKTYYSSILRIGFYLGLALPVAILTLKKAFGSPSVGELQLYGGLALPLFLLLLLGMNMYTWEKTHINYKFIFELNPRDNLDFRQYLELPAIILLVLSFIMCLNFSNTIESISQNVYPFLFVVFICAVIFNPFPILYYNARKWFVFSMARLFGSGILRVEFRDFFIADGLTSLSYSLTMFQLFGRNGKDIYIGDELQLNKYNTSTSMCTPFLGLIPPLLRLFQCLKRYRDTHQVHHLINLFKYLSIIFAIVTASLYNRATGRNIFLQFLWLFTQSFASIYTFSWDVKMDWSLFKVDSINYLLRDELGYEHRWLYYCAIVSNFFFRWSWVALVIVPHQPIVGFCIAFGEVFRRCLWNLFRVENEHINNCEQNRAVKEIPLPFLIDDDIIMPEEFETIGSLDIESDFDRTSFTSWRRRLFTANANRSKSSSADNLRDFEPRKKGPEYIYENIYEESDDDSDGVDEYDVYGRRAISVIRSEGAHGLNNAYASRSFLPIIEGEDMH